ncbi:unnamed protein product [Echinostoma caproni]|uniref:DDE-1 domain-containing protein n=1 Tax=Echinostoma caproni TaxID=27848 RepID=A0A183AZZ4_9TREM|nr:unnamed protein product [Echinostoma caproni]
MLQPVDQNVIWSFKYSFRNNLLKYVLSLIKDEQISMKSEVDILIGMHLIKKAWVSVHSHVLIDAFIKAGFKPTFNQPLMRPPEDNCDLIENFTHYMSIDERLFEKEITSFRIKPSTAMKKTNVKQ